MSQKNKRNNKNKRSVRPVAKTETRRENVTYIPKEESPKGETFFKIVLSLMIVGILAVITYFIVDGIIGNKVEDPYLFDSKMYLNYQDVNALINDQHNNFVNKHLGEAIDQYDGINNIIIVFYQGDYEEKYDDIIIDRHESLIEKVNNMRELMNESEVFEGLVYGRGHAIFYMDVSVPALVDVWANLFEDVDLNNLSTPLLMHVAISHPEYNGIRYIPSVDVLGELDTFYETMQTED